MPNLDQICAVLTDHPSMPIEAYVWHSGGGIMLVRVDVAPLGGRSVEEDPYLLLSPREDYDGRPGIAIGYYPTWEHTGEWPGTDSMRYADDLSEVHAIVLEGAGLLSAA